MDRPKHTEYLKSNPTWYVYNFEIIDYFIIQAGVTSVISSTISTTASGISSTLSTAERVASAITNAVYHKQAKHTFNLANSKGAIGIPEGPCALTELWAWGRNGQNQLGTNDQRDHVQPIKLVNLSTKGLIR